MDTTLKTILKKMVIQERWRKKPKIKGILIRKSKTKSESLRLTLQLKNKKQKKVYVLKKNINLYRVAEQAKKDDILSVAGRTWLGKMFCEKIVNHGKGNKKYFEMEEIQRKLE